MAEASEAAVITTTVEHSEASRLPDPRWLWRRILLYVIAATAIYVLVRFVDMVTDVATLRVMARYAFYTLWLALTLYCVGATVTDVAKLVAAFKTTRKETTTSAAPVTQAAIPATVAAAQPDKTEAAPWLR